MFQPIDAYCERTSAAYWAEPVNALTNVAFLVAALIMWRRTAGLPLARAMCGVLGVIGLGSWLFHTHANRLTALMDVLPILGFILLYLYAATRDLLGRRGWWPWIAVAGFLPYAAGAGAVLGALLPLGSSAAYAPIPPLILAYAWAVGRVAPGTGRRTGRGLALGAAILVASLTFRTLDGPVCAALPLGTHFLWHLLNALMLGWMIEVYRRHMLAKGQPPG
ncbi:ceramidase domain-containing protein [Tabrizicola flagellatus]|uniref:ceramidase domain-containing protein n=1 Tax=Tabrizicola flagellatus TaxID=2593021 RepID=UPI001F1BC461|nr:ceramidase domain-containing protein [Tabrizicola flagellatus]